MATKTVALTLTLDDVKQGFYDACYAYRTLQLAGKTSSALCSVMCAWADLMIAFAHNSYFTVKHAAYAQAVADRMGVSAS